jgi:hypothetical protein
MMETLLVQLGTGSAVHAYVPVPEGWLGPEGQPELGAVLVPDGIDRFAGAGFVPNVVVGLAAAPVGARPESAPVARAREEQSGQRRSVVVEQVPGPGIGVTQLDATVIDAGGAEVLVTCSAPTAFWEDVAADFDAIVDGIELVVTEEDQP